MDDPATQLSCNKGEALRVLIVFNPISGAGRSAHAARQLHDCLAALGHEVTIAPTQLEHSSEWLDHLIANVQALLVVGGDGAVRLAAGAASRRRVPIYHVPMGTENLFAREFGMTRDADTLQRSIERFKVRHVDMGWANGRDFLLMASVGFDADVVHDLAARRAASISQFSYLPPIFSQLRRWRPPRLYIAVDGHTLVPGDHPGFVVVANSREYGWRLNPAGRAIMDDGLLDVAFFPARSRRELIGWALRCRAQRQYDDRRLIQRRGRAVLIRSTEPQRYQLDGDPPGIVHELEQAEAAPTSDQGRFELRIEIRPGALPVLVP